ncbi:MAG: hypothetical protein C4547_05685 [Phycisphaerales bacterium]|nr:MAG: hypothetical protein C4547_05685 [Phycisphaerales bacterium]
MTARQPSSPPRRRRSEALSDADADLQRELTAAMNGWRRVTPRRARELDDRFQLRARWRCQAAEVGARLTALLKQTHRRLASGADALAAARTDVLATADVVSAADVDGAAKVRPTDPRDADWNARLAAHRRRQSSVADIIDALFGPLAKCHPQLWGRRAYCLLVGMIYERLAANEHEIETGELVTLARVLAESRRSENQASDLQRRHEGPDGQDQPGADAELPPNFSDIVRRIYGANFDPVEPSPAAQARAAPP